MITGVVYTIQHPNKTICHFTTDTDYAEFKKSQGYILNARRYKVI